LSSKVEIYDDSESISVSDIAVYSLDINDILAGGTIAISSAVSILEGGTITTTPTIENVTIDSDVNVQVSITVDSPNQVQISLEDANIVTVTDVASLGPAGPAGPAGNTGVAGSSGAIDFIDLGSNPFSVEPAHTGSGNYVGLNIADPQYELHLSQSLFAPLIFSSRAEIKGDGINDLFIVKAYDSEDTKFVINLQGVTILGQFDTTPTPVDGGMFYSASGDFYLGS